MSETIVDGGRSICQAAMLADLSASFPAMKKRPLAEFSQEFAAQDGVWVCGDPPTMPGTAEPIFCWMGSGYCADEEGLYDGYIHTGFVAWLEARGWFWECYDIGTALLVPDSYFLYCGGSNA